MKQYVLDEPAPVAPLPVASPAPSLNYPGRWRWFLLALLLEPIALAALYLGLSGNWSRATPSPAPTNTVAYAASFSFPRQAEPALAEPAVAEPRVSRILQERGRYVVDLHDAEPGPALAMLTQATKARVAGSDIFIGSTLRLTRSALAATPREAWQAVFGDVANFAIACVGNACEVRFVSIAKPGSPVPGADSLQQEFSYAETAPAPALAPPAQAAASPGAAAAPSMDGGDSAPAEN
jgi:hypothetical protein